MALPAGELQRDLFTEAKLCPRCGRDLSGERHPDGSLRLDLLMAVPAAERLDAPILRCWQRTCGGHR